MGFHPHVIAPYKVMKTPPWILIVLNICFELCKYKKSGTDPVLNRYYYYELVDSFTDHAFIFTDESKNGDKTDAAFIFPSFEYSKRGDHPTVQTIMRFLLHTVHTTVIISYGIV